MMPSLLFIQRGKYWNTTQFQGRTFYAEHVNLDKGGTYMKNRMILWCNARGITLVELLTAVFFLSIVTALAIGCVINDTSSPPKHPSHTQQVIDINHVLNVITKDARNAVNYEYDEPTHKFIAYNNKPISFKLVGSVLYRNDQIIATNVKELNITPITDRAIQQLQINIVTDDLQSLTSTRAFKGKL